MIECPHMVPPSPPFDRVSAWLAQVGRTHRPWLLSTMSLARTTSVAPAVLTAAVVCAFRDVSMSRAGGRSVVWAVHRCFLFLGRGFAEIVPRHGERPPTHAAAGCRTAVALPTHSAAHPTHGVGPRAHTNAHAVLVAPPTSFLCRSGRHGAEHDPGECDRPIPVALRELHVVLDWLDGWRLGADDFRL